MVTVLVGSGRVGVERFSISIGFVVVQLRGGMNAKEAIKERE